MPSDFALKTMNTIHRTMIALSGGRLGWTTGNMPVLELTTIGRKSGEPRTAMLTSPIQLDEAIVVVASRGGDDHHPAWFLNLQTNPEVQVSFKGKSKTTMHARVATAEERNRMWPDVVAAYKGYGSYQAKTEREIPLVVLEP
jgi:deazaflavin-dependent oxidoreductase (nitroreductase family)